MQTGENAQGFRKIQDMTRTIGLILLLVHFLIYCYPNFEHWRLTGKILNRLLLNIIKTGLFNNPYKSKLLILVFLMLSLMGSNGRKNEKVTYRSGLIIIGVGLLIYFSSWVFFRMDADPLMIGLLYMGFTTMGYLLVLTGGARLSRVVRNSFDQGGDADMENSGFLQQEEMIRTDYSINLPARYIYKGKTRKSWINLINPRRGILIMGSPGSGKSWFIVENIIRQFIGKGFALFVYDFKYDALTSLVYNQFLKHKDKYPSSARFYSVNFNDLSRSNRCNLLDPASMKYIADAIGASRTILLSMNKTWVNKQGDFFVESPINFLAALIWWLRKYRDGMFCTLPHAIELAQVPYDKLFTILGAQPEISTLINPFIDAYKEKVTDMLGGQVSSAKIPLGRLASPELYYILTGNDLTLDINNPDAPVILCLGGDPQKQEALAPVLSLYIDRVNKLINRKGQHRCAMICDEFATLRAASVLTTIATARSNDIVPVIAVQDLSQLRTQYSHQEADLILNITGNLICGQVGGETAKWVSERFPGTMQFKRTVATNSSDTTFSRTRQMGPAISPASVATLSSGQFLGIVADDPETELDLKAFHAKVINDRKALDKERDKWVELPVVKQIDAEAVNKNFYQVKEDVKELVRAEMARIMGDPGLGGFVVRREK